jgi:hypothetical protein
MRRGSLSERTIKCSKPGCACAQNPKARHGPYYSFTHAVRGKTRSRFLTAVEADLVRQQIDAGRRFRSHVDALWEGMRRMGRQSVGRVLRLLRGAQKRGLLTNLQSEIVQGIETLLGRQAIADLDLEALEIAARRQALRLAGASSGTTAERRHHRSCGAGTALLRRRPGTVSWPSREDV